MSNKTRSTNEIDFHVGLKLREIRRLREITQAQLGQHASISLQQVQKYEQGKNRISVSRLWQFCELLNVTPSYFFEGLGGRAEHQPQTISCKLTYDRAYDAFPSSH